MKELFSEELGAEEFVCGYGRRYGEVWDELKLLFSGTSFGGVSVWFRKAVGVG